jgi:aspartate aminotransferase-like enzyme
MLIMTPGPIAVDERVIAAMQRPVIPHYHPSFIEVMDDTMGMLKRVFGTSGDAIILPGSARIGLEAGVCSVVERGDRTLHIVNGCFGKWVSEIAARAGAVPTVLDSEWGGVLDLNRVEDALKKAAYKLVTVVHSETSTGAVNPIREIGEIVRRHSALYLVDAISSLGALPLSMDDMGIDLCATGSQKALGSITGLSIVGVAPRAYEVMRARKQVCQSYALDLGRWPGMFLNKQSSRPYPVIPSTHLVYALQTACRLVLEEGLPARLERHRRFAEATRRAVAAIGLELFPDRRVVGDSLTGVKPPSGLHDSRITEIMRDKHGIIVGGGLYDLKGKLFRISHMGVQASPLYLLPTLDALEKTLAELGHKFERGAALAEFARHA